MRKVRLLLIVIVLTQVLAVKSVWAHFSSPSFRSPTFSHKGISHSDAPLASQRNNTAPFISRPNNNVAPLSKADQLRYRNADFKSRCLHLENKDPKLGTQNPDIPNMKLKFENPRLRSFNFNAE